MKVPVQEKMAELEQRIIALETALRKRGDYRLRSFAVNEHWKAMWREFDALFKEVFG